MYIGPVMRSCSLEHEEEVSVLLSGAAVEVAKVGGIWDMVDYETQPQQTAQDHRGSSLVTLKAPAPWVERGEGGWYAGSIVRQLDSLTSWYVFLNCVQKVY